MSKVSCHQDPGPESISSSFWQLVELPVCQEKMSEQASLYPLF